MNGLICQICGDNVGLNEDKELFVACNECAFPMCKICYEYERREGNQVCPQCKTRLKRHKGNSITWVYTNSNHIFFKQLIPVHMVYDISLGPHANYLFKW